MVSRYYAGLPISATRKNMELLPKNTAFFGFFMPWISQNFLKTALRPEDAYAIRGLPMAGIRLRQSLDSWNGIEVF